MVAKRPVTIRGVEYASIQEAADALGVVRTTIQQAIKEERLDRVGMRPALKPVTIRGKAYPSRIAAAQALGVGPSTITSAIRRGTLDKVGLPRPHAKPITIGGVTYPTRIAAANALGVTPPAIFAAEKKGRLEEIGSRYKKRPVVLDGVRYKSAHAAHKQTGIGYHILLELSKEQNG